MADPTITIRVKGDTEDAEKKIGGLRGLISKLGENAPKALGAIGLGAAGLAAGAAAGIAKLATDAAKLEGVRNTFDSLTASIGTTSDSMLTTLRGATRGMVNDADLMQASNKFVAMGLAETEEEAAKLAEMATQLGMA
ncbi:MAG: hypothetical protein GWN58_47440, partial [Anaerolineae bacterium]|nr:hypothetical protein [Anaerolineae bacterium]